MHADAQAWMSIIEVLDAEWFTATLLTRSSNSSWDRPSLACGLTQLRKPNPQSHRLRARAAMLSRRIRTDTGNVASAMLTALLRSRLGFLGSLDFSFRFNRRGNYPSRGIAWIRAANVRERSG